MSRAYEPYRFALGETEHLARELQRSVDGHPVPRGRRLQVDVESTSGFRNVARVTVSRIGSAGTEASESREIDLESDEARVAVMTRGGWGPWIAETFMGVVRYLCTLVAPRTPPAFRLWAKGDRRMRDRRMPP